jgi:diketogulonate reductase-like aldo/keto reductase
VCGHTVVIPAREVAGLSPPTTSAPTRHWWGHVPALAEAKGSTAGQIALAWLLARQPWIVPIPGSRRRSRIDENTRAIQVAFSADEVADLAATAARVGVQGDRYHAARMRMVGL